MLQIQKFINQFLIYLLLFNLLLLTGCAKDQVIEEVDNGPELNIHGRISIYQVGKPVVIGNYTWNRGEGNYGWTESFDFIDQNSLPIFKLESDDRGASVKFLDEIRSVELSTLLKDHLGINITPKVLASWFENDHEGKRLPDKFRFNDIYVEVIRRDNSNKPTLMRIRQNDNVVAMSANQGFAEDAN